MYVLAVRLQSVLRIPAKFYQGSRRVSGTSSLSPGIAHAMTFISMGLIWPVMSLQQCFHQKMSKYFSFYLDVTVQVVALMMTGDDH